MTTKLIDALSARVKFGAVLDEIEKSNTRFVVSRRGKPKMVMLSMDDYLQNILKEKGLLAEIQASAGAAGIADLEDDVIDAEISAYRRDKKKAAKR